MILRTYIPVCLVCRELRPGYAKDKHILLIENRRTLGHHNYRIQLMAYENDTDSNEYCLFINSLA